MQGKGLNSGIRGGLWDAKHSDAMRDAVWLFGWLVHRQTTQRNGAGLVLRGKPLSYADIAADTGWPERKLRRWMSLLRQKGYIEVRHSVFKRLVIRVLNAKKFATRQLDLLRFPQISTTSYRPLADDIASANGRFKEGVEIEHKKKEKTRAHTPARVPPSIEEEQRRRIAARDRRLVDQREVANELRAGAGPVCQPRHTEPQALELLKAVAAVAVRKAL